MLWPQDLPQRAAVILSGRDDLVPAELVMAQLKLSRHPAKVGYCPAGPRLAMNCTLDVPRSSTYPSFSSFFFKGVLWQLTSGKAGG